MALSTSVEGVERREAAALDPAPAPSPAPGPDPDPETDLAPGPVPDPETDLAWAGRSSSDPMFTTVVRPRWAAAAEGAAAGATPAGATPDAPPDAAPDATISSHHSLRPGSSNGMARTPRWL